MTTRGEGLRVQLSRIKGVTTGDAAKVLAQPYRFQCPPLESFTVPYSRSFSSYTNYKGTEYLGRGGSQLQPIQFRTIIVEYGKFVVERHWETDRPDRITDDLVHELVDRIRRIWAAGRPFHLLATHAYGRRPELDIRAVLESFNVTETAGEEDTRYLDLSFKQWRDPVVQGMGRGRGPAHTWPKWLELDRKGLVWNAIRISVPGRVALNLDANEWTFALLAKYAYGRASLADHIAAAQPVPIAIRTAKVGGNWGAHTPIMKHPHWKHGGRVKVPAPPPKILLPTGTSHPLRLDFVPGADA